MNEKKETRKFIITIVIFSVLIGLLFSLIFSWLIGDPFKQVVLIGFWFGPIMGIFITIMRFTRGKMVEETFIYDGKEDYKRRIKTILERLKYKLEKENENKLEWKYNGGEFDLQLSGNITVQLNDNTAIVIGPKIIVKKLKEFLNKYE